MRLKIYMEKFLKNQNKENQNKDILGSKNEIDIDANEVVGNYAENLRKALREQKIKKTDPHFEDIDPNKLTNDDLIIFDKFQKNTLTDKEFSEYQGGLKNYFRLQRQLKKEKFNALKDSRSNFSAMIVNKIMAKRAEEMLKERKFKKAA